MKPREELQEAYDALKAVLSTPVAPRFNGSETRPAVELHGWWVVVLNAAGTMWDVFEKTATGTRHYDDFESAGEAMAFVASQFAEKRVLAIVEADYGLEEDEA
jgi:hypothetical protein